MKIRGYKYLAGALMLFFEVGWCIDVSRLSQKEATHPCVSYVSCDISSHFLCSKNTEKTWSILFEGCNLKQIHELRSVPRNKELLAGLCRADIVLSTKIPEIIFSKAARDVSFFSKIGNILDATKYRILSFVQFSRCDLDESALSMATLLASTSLPWNKLICTFRSMFKDGVFHDYSLSEALFVMFLCPEPPGFLSALLFGQNYKKDVGFYIECLAGATKKVMEMKGKKIKGLREIELWKGETYVENIFRQYLESYIIVKEEAGGTKGSAGKAKRD
jgi:hypothetical protein